MKLKIQRLVKIWIEDVYNVKEISEETIDQAINYELDAVDCDELWDTCAELGDYDILDSQGNVIKTIRKHE